MIATQTKTTEISRISSELCPLIHDRNHVWSAIKIAKDRGKQAFDGLRTLVVSVTRSHIFFCKTYQEISLRPSRGKPMNQWKSAEKLMGPGQVWVLCTQVVRFFALRFKDFCGHFVGKKHIAREFCVAYFEAVMLRPESPVRKKGRS